MLAKEDLAYDYAEKRRYEERTIKRKEQRKAAGRINRRLRAKCMIFALVFSVLALATTVRSEVIVSEGYSLVNMNAETTKLEQDNDRLRLEIARLKSPQRIKEIATAELGMVVPKDVYFASQSGR